MDPDRRAKSLSRLEKIEGQLRGIKRMVAEERTSVEILEQIMSARGALRGLQRIVVDDAIETAFSGSLADATDFERGKALGTLKQLLARSKD